jgi:hypothetical protein
MSGRPEDDRPLQRRTLDSPPVSRVTSTCSLRSRISMARPAKITPVSVAIAGEGSEGRRQSQA